MNKLLIPPPPNWFEVNILACAPDNTVVYASRNDIVVIYPKPPEEPADIKILTRFHRDRVVGVVICPNWGNPDKLAVSIGDDKVVCLFDVATCKVKQAHSGHTTRSDRLVGVTFAGHDRVISVTDEGFIVIWRWASNQLNSLSDLLGSKSKVTCVSSCPHASWLTAFGLRRGEIVITDLRKSGRVLYRLKGHDSNITSLSWCPTPYNVFPKYSSKNVKDVKENTKAIVHNVENTTENQPLNVSENLSPEFKNNIESAVEVHKVENTTEDKPLDESENISPELKKNISIESAEDISSSFEKVAEDIETLSPEHQIETEEVKLEPNNVVESFSSRDVMKIICSYENVTNNIVAEDVVETISPKLKTGNKSINLAEDASAKFEIVTESVISENDEKNTSLEHKNDNKVISFKNLTETDSSKIIKTTVNINNCTQENLETLPKNTKIETITTESDNLEAVDIENDSILVVRDLVQYKCLPSHETNANQESHDLEAVDIQNDSILVVRDLVQNKCLPSHETNANQESHDLEAVDIENDSILVVRDLVQNKCLPSHETNANQESHDLEAVDIENDSILVVRDLLQNKCLPSHETNANQESHDDICEDHDSTVENIKTVVAQAANITLEENSACESNVPLKNDVSEDFENQSAIENEPVKEYLLASSARGGRSIIIWRAGTDGIKQLELNLPGKPRVHQRQYQSEEKSWITLCWVTPKNLLSSSPKGELYQWNLTTPSNAKGTYKWRLIHGDHHKQIFGIAAPIRLHESPDDEDWRDRNLLNAWTVGKDRFVLNTSLCAERKTLASFPTFGSINCLASSVTYPSKIGIGGAEGCCRLWDLSRPHLQYIVMTQFSDRTQQKIVTLAWHPTKETILAFGTSDGRIGIMDPCNCSKSPTFFVQHVNSAVHRLDWGPHNGNHENFLLYAVTGGKLIAYDINKKLDAPIVLDVCENVSQMCWKPDYSVCAVGTKAGHVSLYSPEMKLLTTFYVQNKAVRWMTWHPEATIEDDGVSSYANWLAVATNDVTVYDCSLKDGSGHDCSDQIVAVFSEHRKFVECLSWSTFEGGKLASAGDDGMALVWDVKTKTLIHSCMIQNVSTLTSVLWSPLDPDYIITGTKSSIIQIWKLSENPPQENLVRKQQRKMLKLKETEKQEVEILPKEIETTDANPEEVEKIEKPKKNHRRYILGGLVETHNRSSSDSLLKDCKRLFAIHYGKTDYNNEINNEENEDDKQLDILKVFGNEHNLDIVLDLEKKGNSKKKIIRSSSHISLWQGDTANAIREAISTRTLNPWIISMAPTVSHNLYLEACEAYADHLSEDFAGNPYETVSYYLACHKLEKAIDLLCTTKNFIEAIVLAKCRLVHTDPLITKIIERWAQHCAFTGNCEVAAQCYIVLHRLEDAAKILFKRTDEKTLQFCAELAKHCDNKNFLDAVLFRLSTCDNPKDDENPEVPLLTRFEVELNQQKLHRLNEINNVDNNSEGDVPDSSGKVEIKFGLITENNDTVTLGDGQCSTNIGSCFDANNQNLQDTE